MTEAVLLEQRGYALWVTLNRPEKRNAINKEMAAALRRAWREAQSDSAVRAIVLTGAGEAFCSGADLGAGAGFFDPARPSTDYSDLLREVQQSTLPSIARINGLCLAGAFGFLCMTDLAIAADHATFGLPEVKRGLFPMQVLALLQDLVPRRTLREWCLAGENFSAAEALKAGLLNYSVAAAELDATTDWLVQRLTDKSPTAQRRGKYVMQHMAAMSFEQAIAYTESQIGLLAMTEDAREGIAAFLGKRKPQWKGR